MPHVAKSQRHWGLKCLLRDTKFLNTCSFTIDFKKMSVYYKVFVQWWKTNHMETRACWWMVLVLVLLMNNTKCRYFQWIVLLWFLFLFFIFLGWIVLGWTFFLDLLVAINLISPSLMSRTPALFGIIIVVFG